MATVTEGSRAASLARRYRKSGTVTAVFGVVLAALILIGAVAYGNLPANKAEFKAGQQRLGITSDSPSAQNDYTPPATTTPVYNQGDFTVPADAQDISHDHSCPKINPGDPKIDQLANLIDILIYSGPINDMACQNTGNVNSQNTPTVQTFGTERIMIQSCELAADGETKVYYRSQEQYFMAEGTLVRGDDGGLRFYNLPIVYPIDPVEMTSCHPQLGQPPDQGLG